MNFKEWLELQEVNKGFAKTFRSKFPHLNDYVAKQFLSNGLGQMWRNADFKGNRPTAAWPSRSSDDPDATIAYIQPDQGGADSLDDLFSDPHVKERISFDYGKKPMVVTIAPTNIDPDDLTKMMLSDFGNKAIGNVRDDLNRHKKQRALAKERGEENEPIILALKRPNQYKVMEGFHRLMAYFYRNCPENIRQYIDAESQTPWQNIDFSQWPPVRVRAYVGRPLAAAS